MSHGPIKLDVSKFPLDSFYIDGTWIKSGSTSVIDVISPNTETCIATVADANEADVKKAVAAARTAFDAGDWSRLSFKERAAWLSKLADALRVHVDDLALAWTEQIGAPYHRSKAASPFFIKVLDQFAALGEDFEAEQERPIAGQGQGYLVHEPVGVVAAIGPWNVPMSTMLQKISPALLAGCTVVMKPAPETPLEAYIIALCADEIGLPAGVLNLICAGAAGSDLLVRQPGVDKVSFTGSVPTGKRIAAVCAERIARCTLELGGKSAAIILDDYDIEQAAKVLVGAISSLGGQNCAALSRVLVNKDRHDVLVAAMKQACQAITIGGAYNPDAQLGSLATKRQLERVGSYIEKGVEEGATLVFGGQRPKDIGPGYFMEPTLFANVENTMTIAQEEIFGPVLCVIAFDDVDDAIAIANASPYGLAGAVFTHDHDKAKYVARAVRTGTIGQNGPKADFSIGFGGFKQSGLGREGGLQGLHGYLETKTMLLENPSQT